MNLSELSDLTRVIDHLKNVINTAGMNRFKNETLASLKKRLSEFDEMFISEMLNYDSCVAFNRNSNKAIQDAVLEARQIMNIGKTGKFTTPLSSAFVEDEIAEEKQKILDEMKALRNLSGEEKITAGNKLNKKVAALNKKTQVSTDEDKKDTVEPTVEQKSAVPASQSYLSDESLAAMLAQEKQKVAAKKRMK